MKNKVTYKKIKNEIFKKQQEANKMENKTTEQKIKQLKENQIKFARYNKYLIIYNKNKEEIITENLLKVNIEMLGETITLNQSDILYLFNKFHIYCPITVADYNVAIEEDELLKKTLNIHKEIDETIHTNKPLKKALNYYINNKYSSDVLYFTSKIFHNYLDIINSDIIGFHFPKTLTSEIYESLEISKPIPAIFHDKHAIPHFLIQEEDRNILITKDDDDKSQLNGVIFQKYEDKPLYKIIELGRIQDMIYSNKRVWFGDKFNSQPNEYHMVNSQKLLSVKRLSMSDKQTYNFKPMSMYI